MSATRAQIIGSILVLGALALTAWCEYKGLHVPAVAAIIASGGIALLHGQVLGARARAAELASAIVSHAKSLPDVPADERPTPAEGKEQPKP